MSYMKQLWIEREEARAEAAMDSIRDKQRRFYDLNSFRYDQAGNVVAARSTSLASLPTGVDAGTVWACIIDIDLYKKCRPTCCRCGRTDWDGFSFRRPFGYYENKKVSKVTDVGRALVQCLHMGCGWTGELEHVIHKTERPSFYADVKNWLQLNQATAPVAPLVGLQASTERAEQKETWEIFVNAYNTAVKKRTTTPAEASYDGMLASGNDWGSDPGEHVPPETRVPKPTCEANKPEGTRDVDKFLKEQQEKLWRRE